MRDDLDALKIAITGNPNLVIAEGRADYGFLGTVGTIPASLSELWLMGSFPDYTFESTTLVGAGWVGPYVPKSTAERLLALDKDPFGNDFVYTSVPFNRSGDGAEVSARIQSAGPDGVADTADLMTFAAQEVKGSGKQNEIVQIRVESNETVAPDVTIKGVGKTVEIKVEEFIDTATGSGNDVSMSGVEMTVDFSDGSSNTFVIP